MINNKLTRRDFLKTAAISSLGIGGLAKNSLFANAGTPNSSSFASATSELFISDPSQFKILQVTDIHFFAKKMREDWKTLADLPKLVDFTRPDILIVTGDFWHNNPDGRGEEFMNFGIENIERLGIPWAFTWGNHDILNDYQQGHLAFTDAPHSLYSGGSSLGNYVIEVKNTEGDLLWDLICMNSSIGGGTPGLAWMAQQWISALVESRTTVPHAPNAFGFFHIPVPQYKTVWESGIASGVKMENVYSGSQNDSNAFNLFKQLDTMRACFCGHDHVNDYGGKLEGIELVYGRATGYGGYGGDKVEKGGKLITVNCETGEYYWKSILFDLSTGVDESDHSVPNVFQLEQNYPNPFSTSGASISGENQLTTIKYDLYKSAHVELTIYDMMGRKIKTLFAGKQSVGRYKYQWDGTNDWGNKVSAGTYIYRLQAGKFVGSREMTYLK